MRKKTFLMPCIAAVIILMVEMMNKTTKFNNNDYLLMANAEALSSDESYVDNIISVHKEFDGMCWVSETNYSECLDTTHYADCLFVTTTWSFAHDMYTCRNLTLEEYLENPSNWTLCKTDDLECEGHKCKQKPNDELGRHTHPK